MTDALVESLSASISSNINGSALNMAVQDTVKDSRQGRIAALFSEASILSHVCSFRGTYYWFDGTIYVEVEPRRLTLAILDSMKHCAVTDADLCVRGDSMIKYCLKKIEISTIQPSKGIICFKNCVLNIDTGESVSHSPLLHVTNKLGYDYSTSAECNLWHKFLKEVLPERELRDILQEYLGVIFIDRKKAKLEKMLFLVGGGSNGKSVVFETITGILGEDNVSNFDLSQLTVNGGGGGANAYNIAKVDGMLLNYCSDIGKKEINGDGIKNLISGEPTTARMIFKQPYMARDIPVMMANANELPPTTDHSKGYFRRLILLNFNVYISEEKQDTQLSVKLRSEYSGIFNWIIEGRKRFIANGYKFTKSRLVSDAVSEYEKGSSSIMMFLCENRYYPYPIHSGQKMERKSPAELFMEYGGYCDRSNFKKFSVKAFGAKLKEKGFQSGNDSRNGRWYGVYKMPYADDYSEAIGKGFTDMAEVDWGYLTEFKGEFGKDTGVTEKVVGTRSVELFENIVPF